MTATPIVVGGADTHADTVHIAAINEYGQPFGDAEFPTTAAGYLDAITFLTTFGNLECIGIEGTSSYGAGLTRSATTAGIRVVEVNRPDRAERRRVGKSDPIDAYQAARAVLSGRAIASPKNSDIEAIRALLNTHRSAVKARVAADNQITHMLVTAPDHIRDKYRTLHGKQLVKALATCRPAAHPYPTRGVLTALKALAKRHMFLAEQANEIYQHLRVLAQEANPHLLSLRGVGPSSAAQLLITAGANPERLRSEASFAALCGAAPIPASSGKTTRHRLSRGGDRGANRALHTIALVRISHDPHTKAYVQRQREQGRGSFEILRLLKRAIAREIFKSLTRGLAGPKLDDLRPTRQAKNITMTAAAQALGSTITKISRTERGTFPDYELAHRYREWLAAA